MGLVLLISIIQRLLMDRKREVAQVAELLTRTAESVASFMDHVTWKYGILVITILTIICGGRFDVTYSNNNIQYWLANGGASVSMYVVNSINFGYVMLEIIMIII